MSDSCTHLDTIEHPELPDVRVCDACIAIGRTWVHLRLCRECGKIGCCDSSPNRHASAHAAESGHPIVSSLEPGEDWYWCYLDQFAFELQGAPPAPSHP